MRPPAMSSRVLLLAWQLLVVFLAFVPAGRAVVANCTSGWGWSYNSKGQNPCEVAGHLQAACEGHGDFKLGPLDPNSHYPNPGEGDVEALKCGCNTVIYSLYSACTACQNVSTATWTGWSENCDSVYVTQYPFNIPTGVAVPGWSFINVTTVGNFNATAAMNVGRDPEAIGRVPITLFLSTSSLSPPPTPSLAPLVVSTANVPERPSGFDPQPTNGGSGFGRQASDWNDVPSIIAGVLGGAVGLSILTSLVWFSIRRKPHETLPDDAPRPPSRFSLSPRSRYPRSVSVYSPEPEMDESGRETPGIQGRLNAPSRGSIPAQDVRSIISSDSDVQTTHLSVLYGSGRYDSHPEY